MARLETEIWRVTDADRRLGVRDAGIHEASRWRTVVGRLERRAGASSPGGTGRTCCRAGVVGRLTMKTSAAGSDHEAEVADRKAADVREHHGDVGWTDAVP